MSIIILYFVIPEVLLVSAILWWMWWTNRKIGRNIRELRRRWANETREVYKKLGLPPYVATRRGSFICLYCGEENDNPIDISFKYCVHCQTSVREKVTE